ncbi:MAG: hypothetical protein KY467_19220 [Gemmatimonadetes bacterium]|nr:hypothetical protein [Gemmatimonadota bacterium]
MIPAPARRGPGARRRGGGDYVFPEYLRDGRIGFITRASGQTASRIWTVNADGTGQTERIVPGVTAASVPTWQ